MNPEPPSEDARRWPGAEHHPTAYPGARPPGSFLYHRGRVYRPGPASGGLDGMAALLARFQGAPLAERHAVLAVGSNACPGRLLEKFGAGARAAIPVAAGTVDGTAAVHLAGVAAYGAIPATAWAAPGCRTRLWATLLDPAALAVLNASESVGRTYKLVALEAPLLLADGTRIGPLYAYASGWALGLDGTAARLAVFDCDPDGGLPALSQEEVLVRALDALGEMTGAPAGERVRALGSDPGFRRAVARGLRERLSIAAPGFDALPPEPPALRTLVVEPC